jgi:hypothetical protein
VFVIQALHIPVYRLSVIIHGIRKAVAAYHISYYIAFFSPCQDPLEEILKILTPIKKKINTAAGQKATSGK